MNLEPKTKKNPTRNSIIHHTQIGFLPFFKFQCIRSEITVFCISVSYYKKSCTIRLQAYDLSDCVVRTYSCSVGVITTNNHFLARLPVSEGKKKVFHFKLTYN